MVLAAVPLLGLHIGQSGVSTLPANLPSKQGYLAVQHYFPGQSQDPVEIVSVGGTGRPGQTSRSSTPCSLATRPSGPASFRPRLTAGSSH